MGGGRHTEPPALRSLGDTMPRVVTTCGALLRLPWGHCRQWPQGRRGPSCADRWYLWCSLCGGQVQNDPLVAPKPVLPQPRDTQVRGMCGPLGLRRGGPGAPGHPGEQRSSPGWGCVASRTASRVP